MMCSSSRHGQRYIKVKKKQNRKELMGVQNYSLHLLCKQETVFKNHQ